MMDSEITRVPPHSLEAETAVIGAVLLNNEVLTHISLCPEDFYRGGHQILFRAMLALEATGSPIDLVTLAERVKAEGNLERVGGGAYISSLTNQVPSIANANHYAKKVREKAQRRRILQACYETVGSVHDETISTDEITNRLLDIVEEDYSGYIGSSAKEVMRLVFDTLEAAQKGEGIQSIKTGLADLDNLVSIRNGNFVLIAGRPGMGKTSLALAISRAVAVELPVAIFTIEMTELEVGQVFVAQETRVSRSSLYTGKNIKSSDWPRMTAAAGRHTQMRYRVFDKGDWTPAYIRKQSKLMQKKEGLGLIVIDYLQLMQSGLKGAGLYEEATRISKALKNLAKELNVPVICLSQLNRMVEERPDKKPRLSDLRDSGSLEQDADTVLMCYRPEHYWPADDSALIEAAGQGGKKGESAAEELQKRHDNKNLMKILVPKQRAGPTGAVDLQWDAQATNVHTLEKFR